MQEIKNTCRRTKHTISKFQIMYVPQKTKEELHMIVQYYFVTGEKVEVDVPVRQEIESFLEESNRLEENYARKLRHHNYSSDACIYEGLNFASSITPESILLDEELSQHIKETLEKLTEVQRKRLLMLADGYNVLQIAKIEGVHHSTIAESIASAQKKFKKNF